MISIVVCTYNRAALLRGMLRSFFAQSDLDAIDYELIVVDNNSTDETAAVAAEFAQGRALRIVGEKEQGLSHARNRGIREARGEYVAFLDDDVEVDDGWLKALSRCIEEETPDAAGGMIHLIFDAEAPDWFGPKFRETMGQLNLGSERREVGQEERLNGGNLAIRVETLKRYEGFSGALGRAGGNLLAGEETALLRRIQDGGGRLVYDPAFSVGHIIGADRMQWDYMKRMAEGLGRSEARARRAGGFCQHGLRIAHSALLLGVKTGRLAGALVLFANPYKKRRAQFMVHFAAAMLREEIGSR